MKRCLCSRFVYTLKAAMMHKWFPWPSSTFSLSPEPLVLGCVLWFLLCNNSVHKFVVWLYCTSKILVSQLFLLVGGVTSHSLLEDLGWVFAYSNECWFELFQGNRAMALERTSRGGSKCCRTLLWRPLEAVGRSSTPTGVVLHMLPLSSSKYGLFTLTAWVHSHGGWYKAPRSRCTSRLPKTIDSWSFRTLRY